MKQGLLPKDYDKYLKLQTGRSQSKWGRSSYFDSVFRQNLTKAMNKLDVDPKTVICMGCRDGTELFLFHEKYPDAVVYGVDLNENIQTIRLKTTQYKEHIRIYKRDFNKLDDSWGDTFDLVFSNSLDHAYDPHKTIDEWYRICRGFIFVQLAIANQVNQIEHCFEPSDVDKLFPVDKFGVVRSWQNETLNVIAKVKK